MGSRWLRLLYKLLHSGPPTWKPALGSFPGTHQAGHSVQGGSWAGRGMSWLSQAWDFPGGGPVQISNVFFLRTQHHSTEGESSESSWGEGESSGCRVLREGVNGGHSLGQSKEISSESQFPRTWGWRLCLVRATCRMWAMYPSEAGTRVRRVKHPPRAQYLRQCQKSQSSR